MKKDFSISRVKRNNVEVSLPGGIVINGPRNATLMEFLHELPDWEMSGIVGAVVDGELRELTFPIEKDALIEPLDVSSADGSKIYRRSLTFLLQTAFEELFPNSSLVIDHSVPSGGYFCKVFGKQPLTNGDVSKLEDHMRSLVKQDLPIIKEKVSLEDAIGYFSEKNYQDKLRLLKYRQKPYLVLYKLHNHLDYHHGYMVPSSGFLKVFRIIRIGENFILQYPRRKTPTRLYKMPEYDKLIDIFQQYGSWLESLGIESVGALNDAINSGSISEVILVSEALHENRIAQIASQIAERQNDIKVVLISGPSSSGKTTFSKRLAIQLLTYGISPFALEMDNFFVNREDTPLDENGNYDFESFAAIDTELLLEKLKRLLNGEEVALPKFNFNKGIRESGEVVKLKKKQIIVLEGIHGLNPALLPGFSKKKTFRIYTSCLTQLNLDHFNRISTTDTRMIRRIVRDARTRGFSANRTIHMWESVRRGEREYIFPYQENADEIFNSALVYELSALKPMVEPLLRQMPYGTSEYREAKRLLAFLEWFLPVNQNLVPENSILREFIGGSNLSDFKLWENQK